MLSRVFVNLMTESFYIYYFSFMLLSCYNKSVYLSIFLCNLSLEGNAVLVNS